LMEGAHALAHGKGRHGEIWRMREGGKRRRYTGREADRLIGRNGGMDGRTEGRTDVLGRREESDKRGERERVEKRKEEREREREGGRERERERRDQACADSWTMRLRRCRRRARRQVGTPPPPPQPPRRSSSPRRGPAVCVGRRVGGEAG
jgi:hypothetical protein